MPPSDEDLMAQCRDGDVPAFETLMRRHLQGVTVHVRRIVSDPDEAQDLAQDVFMKVYANRTAYTGEGKFTTWLHRIAANSAIDHLRRRSRRHHVSLFTAIPGEEEDEEEAELHETIADTGSLAPCEILTAQEEWASLGSALEHLPETHRQVFEMRLVEGLDYRTISQRLGVTAETARSRMHSAKRELKRSVGGTEEGSGAGVE